ncbi:MAG: hypothetical protein M3Z56_11905, partial [Bacteroidota bacterium]|nr:hypothetical protein [Bacteroidota bacterium]
MYFDLKNYKKDLVSMRIFIAVFQIFNRLIKHVWISVLLLLNQSVSFAFPNTDSLVNELRQAIQDVHIYDGIKLKNIAKLKGQLLQSPAGNAGQDYKLYLQIYAEYQYYNYDSALFYTNRLQELAHNKNELSLLMDSKLKAVFVMLTGGMFKETFDSLNVLSVRNAADSIKAEYYTLTGLAYYNLADFNGDSYSTSFYNNKANLYLDSALAFYAPASFEHLYYSALKFFKKGKPDSALFNLNQLIKDDNLTQHEIALTTSTFGGILISQGK